MHRIRVPSMVPNEHRNDWIIERHGRWVRMIGGEHRTADTLEIAIEDARAIGMALLNITQPEEWLPKGPSQVRESEK